MERGAVAAGWREVKAYKLRQRSARNERARARESSYRDARNGSLLRMVRRCGHWRKGVGVSPKEAQKLLDDVVAEFPFASVESSESAFEPLLYFLRRYVEVLDKRSSESREQLIAKRFSVGGEHQGHNLNFFVGELPVPSVEGIWLCRLPHGKKRFLDFDLGGSFDLEGDS